jgi:hypothetical protein
VDIEDFNLGDGIFICKLLLLKKCHSFNLYLDLHGPELQERGELYIHTNIRLIIFFHFRLKLNKVKLS